MASAIDDTKPVTGTPTTQSVRDNFATAKSEITALQAAVPSWTVGSVPFATSTTALGQDNSGLFYDNTNKHLGIGTTTPNSKLSVDSGSTASSAQLGAIQISGGAAAKKLTMGVDASGTMCGWIQSVETGLSYRNLALQPDGGNVGIGTAAPGAKLDVNGGITAAGNLYAGNSASTGDAVIEIGNARTGVGNAIFDMHSSSGVDFDFRILRSGGTNGFTDMNNAGTGGITFTTNAVTRGYFDGTGSFVVGSPTGGGLGAGKINAVEVRANNVVLTSDSNLKADIEPLSPALPVLAAIEPRSFRWRGLEGEMPPDFTTRLNRGFIVQEVIEALGGKVEDGVDLGGMVAVLWQAVRELSARVAELEDDPAPRH